MSRADVLLADCELLRMYGHSLAPYCLKGWAARDKELGGISIEVQGFPADLSARDIAEAILAARPRLTGFSCYVWNARRIWEVVAHLKRSRPELPVVLGGPQVAGDPEAALLGTGADFVCAAEEGEESFRQFLRFLFLKDRSLRDVRGLAFRENGVLVRTPEPELIDLDLLPPLYSGGLCPLKPGAQYVILETSRGCPFSCKFCDWGPKQVRRFPVGLIEREFSWLAREGVPFVGITDADILREPQFGLEVIRAFLRASEGTRTRLAFESNPAFLGKSPALDLIEVHPSKFTIGLGVQTINPETNRRLKRPFRRDAVEGGIAELHRRAPGADSLIEIICGLPGDTLESWRETVDWAIGRRPSQIAAYHALVLPGTALAREAAGLGVVYQQEPPHHVLSTMEMVTGEMRLAKTLAFYVTLSSQLGLARPLADFVDVADGPREPRAYVRALEDWMSRLALTWAELAVQIGRPADADVMSPFERAAHLAVSVQRGGVLRAAVDMSWRNFVQRKRLTIIGGARGG